MSPSKPRTHYLSIVCIFAVAMLLRFVYLAHLRQLPMFGHPIMDASYHDTWAREITDGNLLREEPFFRAPLYPYLLAFLYKVSGGSYLLPRLVQFFLGGLTSVATYLLARRLLGPIAGIIAGLCCSIYPVLIYFEGELLTETLFTFLCMCSLLALDTARRRSVTVWWFLAGLCLGLALITRPTVTLFLLLAGLGCLAVSRRKVLAVLMLVVGIGLPVAPVTLHNYLVSREFIPLVWQDGLNFYLGNNPAADGWSATSPEIRKDWWGGYRDMIAIPRESMGRQPRYTEVSAFWRHKATEFIRNQPGAWLRLMLKKVALFWDAMELPNNQDFNFARLQSWVLRNPVVNFGVIAPLCLVGVFTLLPRFRQMYFVYAFLVAYFAATIAFFVCSRYRAPVVPVLCVFAGGSVSFLIERLRAIDRRSAAVWIAVLAAAAVAVKVNFTAVELPGLAQSYTQVGKVYMELNQDDEAARSLERALAENPAWGDAYEQLGLIGMKHERMEEAERCFLKAVEVMPQQATAHRALAMVYLRKGSLRKARESVTAAIRIAPFLEDGYNLLGSIHMQEGKVDSAISSFLKELERWPHNWRALANLGGAYWDKGDLDEAAAAYEKAADLNPDDPSIVLALASVYSDLGKDDLAGSTLERLGPGLSDTVGVRYNQAVILQNAGNTEAARRIYEGILREAPLHEGALVNLGVIYANAGLRGEALGLWHRALDVNPENKTARRNVELLGRRDEPSP